ncbi:MAG: putative toxin-antitoxin system toxin component, PIN family [Fibromonadaceae bacterium]|jgi:putative PIN family toxin of toxin-antitoxin system|nr:putative toxin-antitoxin system toxin component, PIN family [Fibromonadaceae bacterium]
MPKKQNKPLHIIKVVIDTNVAVSSLLSDKGHPAHIINLVKSDSFIPYYNISIMEEYMRVLKYPKFNFKQQQIDGMLNLIKKRGVCTERISTSENKMIDETDRMFYDLHKAVGAILITGNAKHYPKEPSIMSPADFMEYCSLEADDD